MGMSCCPICQAAFAPLLRREDVPVHQNLVLPTPEAARAIPRGTLDLAVCTGCGFVSNLAFDGALMAYDADYDNRQDLSPAFQAHLDARIERVLSLVGHPGHIIEVGCGNGLFLDRLVRTTGARGTGFDPAYTGDVERPGLTVHRSFYGPEVAHDAPDLVVSRHVIEHVPDPVALLRAVAQSVAPGTPVVFETPDLAWIARHDVWWDLFYEHCSYFTGHSLAAAFEAAGLGVQRIERVFDGQYLWIEALAGQPSTVHEAPQLDLTAFATRTQAHLHQWRTTLAAWSADGGVAVWGVGAKGNTFLSAADPEAQWVRFAVDINPGKQGGHVVGPGHAVLAPDALPDHPVQHVVVTNPAYLSEIRQQLDQLGLNAQLHTQDGAS